MSASRAVVNQTRLCVEMLANERGFIAAEGKPWSLYKVVDDNHALLADVTEAHYARKPNSPVNLDLSLAIARRDINERFIAWVGLAYDLDHSGWFRRTVRVAEELGTTARKRLRWTMDQPFESYRDEVLELIDQLATMANLSDIEKVLYEPGNHEYAFARAINDALNGDFRSAEQWAVRRDAALARPEGDKKRLRMERFEQSVQAFRIENPNGVHR